MHWFPNIISSNGNHSLAVRGASIPKLELQMSCFKGEITFWPNLTKFSFNFSLLSSLNCVSAYIYFYVSDLQMSENLKSILLRFSKCYLLSVDSFLIR